jgi:putative tricarboxylic transport membrane protein
LRLTFGVHQLEPGLRLLPVVLGMFVLSQVIADIVNIERTFEMLQASRRSMFMRFSDMKHQTVNFIRSSLIGTWIGILPGVGSTIASIVSYTMARNLSKTPERYGTGYEDGIVAAETANNAAVNGALVPLITLGIPGSVIDAILLGAFLIHNITPGPLLFQTNPDLVYGIIAAALLANVLMFVVMLAATPYFAKLMVVPKAFLLPTIVVFCVIGAYATSNLIFDVWVMLAFGVIGYFMQRAGLSIGPFVIGYVLTPIAEVNLRSGLMLYDGSLLPLVTRPYALTFLIIAILTLLWPFLRRRPTNATGGNDP